MDPLGLTSIFSTLLGAWGSVNSFGQTDQMNQIASQIQSQETKLLSEATQQQEQMAAAPGLIAKRNSQEQLLNPPNKQFDASKTILTSPLGMGGMSQPKQLLEQ